MELFETTQTGRLIRKITYERGVIRRNVQRWGIRAVCLICKRQIRHRPETNGRLRHRACATCGVCSLRSYAWVKTHQKQANQLRRAHLSEVECFQLPLGL